jgi:hypothetical protein
MTFPLPSVIIDLVTQYLAFTSNIDLESTSHLDICNFYYHILLYEGDSTDLSKSSSSSSSSCSSSGLMLLSSVPSKSSESSGCSTSSINRQPLQSSTLSSSDQYPMYQNIVGLMLRTAETFFEDVFGYKWPKVKAALNESGGMILGGIFQKIFFGNWSNFERRNYIMLSIINSYHRYCELYGLIKSEEDYTKFEKPLGIHLTNQDIDHCCRCERRNDPIFVHFFRVIMTHKTCVWTPSLFSKLLQGIDYDYYDRLKYHRKLKFEPEQKWNEKTKATGKKLLTRMSHRTKNRVKLMSLRNDTELQTLNKARETKETIELELEIGGTKETKETKEVGVCRLNNKRKFNNDVEDVEDVKETVKNTPSEVSKLSKVERWNKRRRLKHQNQNKQRSEPEINETMTELLEVYENKTLVNDVETDDDDDDDDKDDNTQGESSKGKLDAKLMFDFEFCARDTDTDTTPLTENSDENPSSDIDFFLPSSEDPTMKTTSIDELFEGFQNVYQEGNRNTIINDDSLETTNQSSTSSSGSSSLFDSHITSIATHPISKFFKIESTPRLEQLLKCQIIQIKRASLDKAFDSSIWKYAVNQFDLSVSKVGFGVKNNQPYLVFDNLPEFLSRQCDFNFVKDHYSTMFRVMKYQSRNVHVRFDKPFLKERIQHQLRQKRLQLLSTLSSSLSTSTASTASTTTATKQANVKRIEIFQADKFESFKIKPSQIEFEQLNYDALHYHKQHYLLSMLNDETKRPSVTTRLEKRLSPLQFDSTKFTQVFPSTFITSTTTSNDHDKLLVHKLFRRAEPIDELEKKTKSHIDDVTDREYMQTTTENALVPSSSSIYDENGIMITQQRIPWRKHPSWNKRLDHVTIIRNIERSILDVAHLLKHVQIYRSNDTSEEKLVLIHYGRVCLQYCTNRCCVWYNIYDTMTHYHLDSIDISDHNHNNINNVNDLIVYQSV